MEVRVWTYRRCTLRNLAKSFQEFIQNRAFSTIDALEVVNENACVEEWAFSIHAFLPLSFSQDHPASETSLYAL